VIGYDKEVYGHGLIDVIPAIANGRVALNLSKHIPCSDRDLNRETPENKQEALLNEPNCSLPPCYTIMYEFSNDVAQISMSAVYMVCTCAWSWNLLLYSG
jgi:hypothetical protein